MKRGKPLTRRTPLARATAPLRRVQALGRGNGPVARSDAQNARNALAVPDKVREAVWKREHGRCARCREKVTAGLHGHHIHHCLPRRLWPEHAAVAANLVLLCPPCHLNHEHGARNDSRLSVADDLPDETVTWLAEVADGPILNYIDRSYRL